MNEAMTHVFDWLIRLIDSNVSIAIVWATQKGGGGNGFFYTVVAAVTEGSKVG